MRRRRRDSGGSPSLWFAVSFLLVVLAFGGGLEASAFSTGTVDRPSTIDVVADADATLGIDSASSVAVGSTSRLVDVADRLDQRASVTVELRPSSTTCCDLYVNGANEGDSAALSLASGATETVSVSVANDSLPDDGRVAFDVRASAPGVQVDATNRSVPIGE